MSFLVELADLEAITKNVVNGLHTLYGTVPPDLVKGALEKFIPEKIQAEFKAFEVVAEAAKEAVPAIEAVAGAVEKVVEAVTAAEVEKVEAPVVPEGDVAPSVSGEAEAAAGEAQE